MSNVTKSNKKVFIPNPCENHDIYINSLALVISKKKYKLLEKGR